MAKVRKTYRYIRIDSPKEPVYFSEEKRKNLKELVKSYGLKVKNVSNSTRAEPGGFAHGGTFYGIDILSIEPPSVFIEDDNFYQYGISYTRPNFEWETFVEGTSSETLKGGVGQRPPDKSGGLQIT